MAPEHQKGRSAGRRLIAGLGNPGAEYALTRHNAGFMVVEKLALDFDIALGKSKFNALYGTGRLAAAEVVLAKPMAYMNRSGPPVQQLAAYYRIPSQDVLVVHDDIDLVFGRIKIKAKGGHGGHNGIKSLKAAFGGGDFVRLRIGIGRSESGRAVTDHVLSRFAAEEAAVLEETIARAAEAVVTILKDGVQAGMNSFNRKQPND